MRPRSAASKFPILRTPFPERLYEEHRQERPEQSTIPEDDLDSERARDNDPQTLKTGDMASEADNDIRPGGGTLQDAISWSISLAWKRLVEVGPQTLLASYDSIKPLGT